MKSSLFVLLVWATYGAAMMSPLRAVENAYNDLSEHLQAEQVWSIVSST